MKNNILKTLSNNLGFKILAVLFAFTLWIVVYNLEDPTKSKTLTVSVSITNKEAIENQGKYFEVLDGTGQISFSVTAARSVLDKLDESDFLATANMEQLTVNETGMIGTVPVEITCTANGSKNAVKINASNKTMKVSLEDLMSKQFVVKPSAYGEVAPGYALGGVEVTAPNVLKVSGPKSIVQKIASVIAPIDVTDMSESWTTYRSTPVLLDSEGNEIDTTRLTFSDTTVTVEAEILNTKDVTIGVAPKGTVAAGYTVTSITSNPATIQLKGNKTVLNSISMIEIPGDLINISGANQNVSVSIDISEYIPAGAELVNTEDATVTITVNISKIKGKAFSVSTDNIEVIGLQTNATLTYELSSVAVNIEGVEGDINDLTSEEIKGSIDVTNLGPGTHEVVVDLDLDEQKYKYDTVKVTITITQYDEIVQEPIENGDEEE